MQRLHGRLDDRTDGAVAWMHKDPAGDIHTLYSPPRQVPARAARWSSGHTWVSVGTFLPHRRAVKNSCCVPALWVDIDPPEEHSAGLAAWQCATHRRLMAFVPSPSLIVFTGRGFHSYWLFTEPVRVRESHARAGLVVQANGVLQRRLKGDTVGDLARVLRVPGSVSPKTNTRCRLLVEDGPMYDFDNLVRALHVEACPAVSSTAASSARRAVGVDGMASASAPEKTRLPRGRGRPTLDATVRDLRGLPPWARALVVGGVWSARGRYQRPGGLDRSRADLAAIGAMVRASWPDSRITAAFRRRDWLVGARYGQLAVEGTRRAEGYLALTIAKARSAVELSSRPSKRPCTRGAGS